MFNLDLDSWLFFKKTVAVLVVVAVLIKTSQNIFLEKHKGNLVKKIKSQKEFPEDDKGKNKSRWERFKDWCSRNKVYIGLGVLTILAVVALYQFSGENGGESASFREVPKKWEGGWVNAYPGFYFGTPEALKTEDFFFPESTNILDLTGEQIFAKEKALMKRIFEIFNFYRQQNTWLASRSEEETVQAALDTMRCFLKCELDAYSIDQQRKFYHHYDATTEIYFYNLFIHNNELGWESADRFRVLFNFLTRSPMQGAHSKALEAFDIISKDFIAKVDSMSNNE